MLSVKCWIKVWISFSYQVWISSFVFWFSILVIRKVLPFKFWISYLYFKYGFQILDVKHGFLVSASSDEFKFEVKVFISGFHFKFLFHALAFKLCVSYSHFTYGFHILDFKYGLQVWISSFDSMLGIQVLIWGFHFRYIFQVLALTFEIAYKISNMDSSF